MPFFPSFFFSHKFYLFQVALLTDFETSLLKAVRDVELRFRFHQDFDLFTFVSQLSIGDRVVVQVIFAFVELEKFTLFEILATLMM